MPHRSLMPILRDIQQALTTNDQDRDSILLQITDHEFRDVLELVYVFQEISRRLKIKKIESDQVA